MQLSTEPPATIQDIVSVRRASVSTTGVLLVDDNAMVRTGLRALLGTAPDLLVVGEADSGEAAVQRADELRPDVVLMDVTMPGMGGAAATATIVSHVPGTHVLVVTMHGDGEGLLACLEAGAIGYIVKDVAERELVDAVRAVARGEPYLRTRTESLLAARRGRSARDPHGADRTRFETLSSRERVVLQLTAEGYSAPEIGERLVLSPKTVDTYKGRIASKLGLHHRSDYVRFALRLGLLAAN